MTNFTLRKLFACCVAACISNVVANNANSQVDAYSPDIVVLDGSKSLAIKPHPSLGVSGDLTIEFWAAPGWEQDPGYDPVIVSNLSAEKASYIVAILRDREGVGVVSGEKEIVAPFNFKDGKLHHVAIIQSGNELLISIDGVIRGVSEMKLNVNEVDAFWIGSIDGSLGAFIGDIGQLRIWNDALDLETLEAFKLQSAFSQYVPAHPFIDALIAVSVFPEAGLLLVESQTDAQ